MENKQKVGWDTHLQKQKVSGLTVLQYCHKHGLTSHQFYYWKRKLGQVKNAEPAFLEVFPNTRQEKADKEIIVTIDICNYKLFRFGIKIIGILNNSDRSLLGQP